MESRIKPHDAPPDVDRDEVERTPDERRQQWTKRGRGEKTKRRYLRA